MAEITLDHIAHSYHANPDEDSDWALKEFNVTLKDGGAYALLGPSGCGKTTLLNIISGLLKPSHGNIKFNDVDVTHLTPEERHIAQVFQFPVIYDTMSVYDNLAFPLKNKKINADIIDQRVREIASLTDLTPMLHRRASGLTADGKQKISLGRGLVRDDVNVIMFDEPLTVIDPHLKWKLRSKLKELHLKTNRTMVYVTHDQTEALTFADQVVVMNYGKVLQIATPSELFERPKHAFVGFFIGSPGMNFIDCDYQDKHFMINDIKIDVANNHLLPNHYKQLQIGIRPEFVKIVEKGYPAKLTNITNVGKNKIIDILFSGHKIKAVIDAHIDITSQDIFIEFDKNHCFAYCDQWLIEP